MKAAGLRGTARSGMRGGGRGAQPWLEDEPEAPPLEHEEQLDLAALMSEALWQPLQEKYPEVTRWSLATHQDLHLLPVRLGADPSHQAIIYPGLLFLARKQAEQPAANDNVPVRLAMHSDPAAGTGNPIPFVEAEVRLIHAIWGEDKVAVSTGEATLDQLNTAEPALDALLLAAHGDELATEPPQTIVWLDRAKDRLLDTTAVLSSAQRPSTIIASACVAGRVREDHLGEPLGLVTSFFLHGGRFVLAPLQPVPDLYAPLVYGLFHRSWQEIGNPRLAWQKARTQALTGAWPEGYAEQVEQAYRPVMHKMLEQVAKGDLSTSTVLDTGWLIELTRLDTPEGRARLVEDGIAQILAQQARPSANIRHICDWTAPFGG